MESNFSNDFLRIIDANLNRLGEGLRFLEEITRFMLNDLQMSRDFKQLRHLLDNIDPALKKDLLSSRDIASDVGIDLQSVPASRELVQSVLANARRVEEASRVLEELAKLPDSMLDSRVFQKVRFDVYTLEKCLVSKLTRREKIKRMCGLYPVIDVASLGGRDPVKLTSEILSSGVAAIQLRAKAISDTVALGIGLAIAEICRQHDALLIINDRPDIATACDADGVHLGQDDLPVTYARNLLGVGKIIGCSVQTVEQACQAVVDGADYLGVGPVFPTASKNCSAFGCGLVTKIKEVCDLPVIAIGGIQTGNLESVLEAGADGLAVISAIMSSESLGKATAELVQRIGKYREQTH